MNLPHNITEIAFDCGFAWPDDPDGQMDVLVGIAESSQLWRHKCDQALCVAYGDTVKERMYKHQQRRNRALATRLRNLRTAWREYRSRQNRDEFIRRMCDD